MMLVRIATVVGLLGSLRVQCDPTEGEQEKRRIILTFEAIKNKCTEIRESYTQLKTKDQIVCISVMSRVELLAEELQPNLDIKDFVNKKVKNISETGNTIQSLHSKNSRKEVHGEIIALRLDDFWTEFKKKYSGTSTEESARPYLFIYSHFLPCASLLKIPYSCSEELAKQALLTRDNLNMLVGYSEVFSYTNDTIALGYLHHDSIYALVNVTAKKCEIRSDSTFFKPRVDIFQNKLHQCIGESPEIEGCQHCRTPENTEITIRDKINALILKFIHIETLERRGPLTYLDMRILQTCFKDKKWFNVCSQATTSQGQLAEGCFTQIMEDAHKNHSKILVLGQPFDTEPFWRQNENLSIEWEELYRTYKTPESTAEFDKPEHQANERKRTRSRNRSDKIKRQRSNDGEGC